MIKYIIEYLMVLSDIINDADEELRGEIADIFVRFLTWNGKFTHQIMVKINLCHRKTISKNDWYEYVNTQKKTSIGSIVKTAYLKPWSLTVMTWKVSKEYSTFEEAEAEMFKHLRKHNYIYVGDISD